MLAALDRRRPRAVLGPLSRWTCASPIDEQAFATEVRAWLAAHLEAPPAVRRCRRGDRVGAGVAGAAGPLTGGWASTGPSTYGGRDASPVEVALFNMEYARARRPQPVNRVGINLAGPTLLAHGTEEQKSRWLPSILDASELWCQLFSEPDAGSDLASLTTRAAPRRRRLAGQRPEGLDLLRPVRPLGHLPGPHRCRRPPPPGHLLPGGRHGGPGHRDPAAAPDHRRGRVQRGLPRRGLRARATTWSAA